jgi:hypothetical protein
MPRAAAMKERLQRQKKPDEVKNASSRFAYTISWPCGEGSHARLLCCMIESDR